MTAISGMNGPNIAKAYDFSRYKRIVDVAGGQGALLKAILAEHPALSDGVVLEQDFVVEEALQAKRINEEFEDDVSKRVTFVTGNIFEELPIKSPCFIMRHILHDWDDESCVKILANLAQALEEEDKGDVVVTATDSKPYLTGRIIIADYVVPEYITASTSGDMFSRIVDESAGGVAAAPELIADLTMLYITTPTSGDMFSRIVDESAGGVAAAAPELIADLTMLTSVAGGKERTLSEFSYLAARAGLVVEEVCNTPSLKLIVLVKKAKESTEAQ
eukprot:gene5199-18424_t